MTLDLFAGSPHRRAYLASAGLVVLLLLLIVAGGLAYASLADDEALLEQRQSDLQAIAARLKARGPGLARAERTLAADPFLPGATPTLAANGLQRRVVELAEACGVTLRTIGAEPSPTPEPGELPSITLQANAQARIAPLQKLLHRLETESPFVLVDEVSIRAPQTSSDGVAPSRDPELAVELRLIGFLHRKEGGS